MSHDTIIISNTQKSYMDMAKTLAERAKDKSTSRSLAYKCREASKALQDLFSAEVLESASQNGAAVEASA